MASIQKKIVKQGKRNVASRLLHAKNDKEIITAWKQDLNKILHVFNVSSAGPEVDNRLRPPFQTELLINNHMMLLDIHRNTQVGQGGTDSQRQSVRIACSSPMVRY